MQTIVRLEKIENLKKIWTQLFQFIYFNSEIS